MSIKATAANALHRAHGVPVQIRPDAVDEDGTAVVRVYRVRDRAAALAYVDAEVHGPWRNPARAELRESVGWVVVVDLRAFVAGVKAEGPALPRIRG